MYMFTIVTLAMLFVFYLPHIMHRQAKSRVTNSTTGSGGGIEVTREVSPAVSY